MHSKLMTKSHLRRHGVDLTFKQLRSKVRIALHGSAVVKVSKVKRGLVVGLDWHPDRRKKKKKVSD